MTVYLSPMATYHVSLHGKPEVGKRVSLSHGGATHILLIKRITGNGNLVLADNNGSNRNVATVRLSSCNRYANVVG